MTGRLILEGIIEKSKKNGFFPLPEKEKGRIILFNEDNFVKTPNVNIYIYKCYDIRVLYLKDIPTNTLRFYTVVDLRFLFRNGRGRSLNYRDIVQFYGSHILKEIRVIQKDFVEINGEYKVNTEVSRQRLFEDILPFVKKIGEFVLPCGIKARLSATPCRIIVVT